MLRFRCHERRLFHSICDLIPKSSFVSIYFRHSHADGSIVWMRVERDDILIRSNVVAHIGVILVDWRSSPIIVLITAIASIIHSSYQASMKFAS